jgi:hypothetical protein
MFFCLVKQILWLWQQKDKQKKCAREFIPCNHMQMKLDHICYQFTKLEGKGQYVGNRRGMQVNRFRRRLKILKKTIDIYETGIIGKHIIDLKKKYILRCLRATKEKLFP